MYKKTLNILTICLFLLLLFQVGWWIGTTSTTIKYQSRNYISILGKTLKSTSPTSTTTNIIRPNVVGPIINPLERPKQQVNFTRHHDLPTCSTCQHSTIDKSVIATMRYNVPYNVGKKNKLEGIQSVECGSISEASSMWNPIQAIIPEQRSVKDMLGNWKNFAPSRVRAVITRNMILDGDSFERSIGDSFVENPNLEETEFSAYFKNNLDSFEKMTQYPNMDGILEEWKGKMNELNFVLNHEKFKENQTEDHLPIWLRAYRRTKPLDEVLRAVCNIRDVEQSILIITIDGESFLPVLYEILKVKCVKIRIYFHALKNSLQGLLGPNFDETDTKLKSTTLLTHALYGLFLCFVKYRYPYVITLEDDIKPFPDFYNYHRSLYKHTINETSPYFAVSSYAHGHSHNCRFISSALYNSGLINNLPQGHGGYTDSCKLTDVDQLVMEGYYAVWGSGIPLRIFKRLFFTWTFVSTRSNYFLGSLMRDLRKVDERMISPCSNRINRLDNVGMNGKTWYDEQESERFWVVAAEVSERTQQDNHVNNWKYDKREYTVLQ